MRFRVLVNGAEVCTAGVNGLGVLTALVVRGKRNPRSVAPDLAPAEREAALAEYVELEVGGLDSNDEAGPGGKQLRWLSRELQTGDRVTIEILSPGACDAPI